MLADDRVIGRIDGEPARVPDLDPRDLSTLQAWSQGGVELRDVGRGERLAHGRTAELRLNQRSLEEQRGFTCVDEGALTDLSAQDLREHQAEQDDRDQACDRELTEQTEPGSRRRGEETHRLRVIGPPKQLP